jgi:hypothetical protein
MLHYLTLNTAVEFLCLLVAIICLFKDKSPIWKTMAFFLLVTCISELAGIYFKRIYVANGMHGHQNVWIYNILLIFQACFFSLMFQHLLSKYFGSKSMIIGGLAAIVAVYIYELADHGIFLYNQHANTVMLVLLMFYGLSYYYNLFRYDKYINLLFYPDFWWVAGVLFFYFGSTACDVYFDNIPFEKAKSLGYLSSAIFKILNVILYTCWSYSFICRKWLWKSAT